MNRSSAKDSVVLSPEEENIYFEIVSLLEAIEDPTVVFFYDQIETICAKFKIVEKEKIMQYFEKLVSVVGEDDKEEIRRLLPQIKRISELLIAYRPLGSQRASQASMSQHKKKEFESIDNMKPRRSASSSIGEISDEEALNMEVQIPD